MAIIERLVRWVRSALALDGDTAPAAPPATAEAQVAEEGETPTVPHPVEDARARVMAAQSAIREAVAVGHELALRDVDHPLRVELRAAEAAYAAVKSGGKSRTVKSGHGRVLWPNSEGWDHDFTIK